MVFRGSAVKRTKWRGLIRNACVAAGNSGIMPPNPAYGSIVLRLENLAAAEDAIIAEHATWALKRLHPSGSTLRNVGIAGRDIKAADSWGGI